MTTTAMNDETATRPARKAMTLKWMMVFAAMVGAIVLDGVATFDANMIASEAVASGDQAAITLPADRCEPGCTIMMASNPSGDRVQ